MDTPVSMSTVLAVHRELRSQNPLVQYITNYVSMDIAANVLNAAGPDGIAVISAICDADDPHEAALELREIVDRALSHRRDF